MISRRTFLKGSVILIGGMISGSFIKILLEAEAGNQVKSVIIDDCVSPPLMLREYAPDPKALYGMVIDITKCTGCHSCATACRNEFNVPPGVWRSWVKTAEKKDIKLFLPRLCNHCDKPPCCEVCPVKASYRREDGVVLVRYSRCIGCKMCMTACPYDARFVHPVKGVVDKCTFCVHRVDEGREPACVEICPARARIFGKINDPSSEVANIISSKPTQVLKPHLRTDCKVYYVDAPREMMGRIKIGRDTSEIIEKYPLTIPEKVLRAFMKYNKTIY